MTRRQVFVAKLLAAATSSVGLLVVTAASGVVSGLLLAGSRPLVGLGGQTVSPAGSVVLVGVSWASVLPSVLGFTALGVLLSVLSRNSVLGVGGPVVPGLVMTLLALVDGLGVTSHLLLTTPLFAWHGLWQPAATVAPVLAGGAGQLRVRRALPAGCGPCVSSPRHHGA